MPVNDVLAGIAAADLDSAVGCTSACSAVPPTLSRWTGLAEGTSPTQGRSSSYPRR
jgi:hypothetical protein